MRNSESIRQFVQRLVKWCAQPMRYTSIVSPALVDGAFVGQFEDCHGSAF